MSEYSVTIPEDLPRKLVTVVERETPAWDVMMRICRAAPKPGMVVPCTKEELDSLLHDTAVVEIA